MDTLLGIKFEENLFVLLFVILPCQFLLIPWTLLSLFVTFIEGLLISCLQAFFAISYHLGLIISLGFFLIGWALLLLTSSETQVGLILVVIGIGYLIIYFIGVEFFIDFEDVNQFGLRTLNILLIGFATFGYLFADFSVLMAGSSAFIGILGMSGARMVGDF